MQDVVFVSQVVQPLTTLVTFFSVEINGAKEPRRCCLRGGCARLSTSRIQQERELWERRGPSLARTHGIFRC